MIFPSWSRKVASQHPPEPLRRVKVDECIVTWTPSRQIHATCYNGKRLADSGRVRERGTNEVGLV